MSEPAKPQPDRTATFAGFLGHGDHALSADNSQVIIHREARGPEPYLHAVHRTIRPFLAASLPWSDSYGGLGMDEIAESETPHLLDTADAAGFCPGEPLETWLLPLRSEHFEYIVTPRREGDL